MSVASMSILGAIMAALIIAFFASIFTSEKVDLSGRLEKSRVNELVGESMGVAHISNTRYGTLYKQVVRKRLGDKGIKRLAQFFGIDLSTLQENIELAGMHEKISAEEIVSMKFLGLCGGILFGGGGIWYQDMTYILAGGIVFFAGFFLPQDKIKGKLKQRNISILDELPGFIERTYMCMESGANLRQALEMIADSSGGELGREFKAAFALSDYGTGWERELELMGDRIQVEALQDFVVDIIMANSKGISVTDTLKEEAEHINTIRRSNAMMAIGALETRVMLLVMVFSLVPTMGILMLPVLINSLAIL